MKELWFTSDGPVLPEQLTWFERRALMIGRYRLQRGDANVQAGLQTLLAEADHWMTQGPWSVTYKQDLAPTKDPHDYVSQSPYFWPNPITKKPYIPRDGRVNPERDKLDSIPMSQMCQAAQTLALAWWFTGQERYAERAALVLRTWYVDPATRMNPHMRFAQRVPGLLAGAWWGIIESHLMVWIPDCVAMMQGWSGWTQHDTAVMQRWFGDMARWLLTSRAGRMEARMENNHGTWYDVQVASFSLFAGDTEQGQRVIMSARRRLVQQLRADGSQPHELARTLPTHYCLFNLKAWVALARVGETLGDDLWRWRDARGVGLPRALEWLEPILTGARKPPKRDLRPHSAFDPALIWRRAARAYHAERYEAMITQFRPETAPEMLRRLDLLEPLVFGRV